MNVLDYRQSNNGDSGSSEGPLYTQVRDQIIQRIVDGVWDPGDLMPAEAKLAREFGVSQGTVRKALDDLASRNLVIRQQGRGTFIAVHDPRRELFHFFPLVRSDGTRELPSSRVIANAVRHATGEESNSLDIPLRSKVVHIDRVRDVGGRPVVFEEVVVPARIFPGLETRQFEDLPNALYALFEEAYGVIINRAVEHLGAIPAGEHEREHLGVPIGTPLLEIDRVALSLEDKPVERRVSRCLTENYRYLSILA
jgi:GntR family transcriptional regulator